MENLYDVIIMLRPGGSFCRDLCETRKALLSYD